MNFYSKKANFLLGYIDVRFNRMYGDETKDKDAEINIWALELSLFTEEQLSDINCKNAIDYYVDTSTNKSKPPSVDQFSAGLRKVSYVESVMLEHKSQDWIDMFNKTDNKGKFSFFVKNRTVPPSIRDYAREWFGKNTKFTNDAIYGIVNGKITT